MRNSNLCSLVLMLLIGIFLVAGCKVEETAVPANNPVEEREWTTYPSSMTLWGLSSSNELFEYRSGPPATLMRTVPISGLRDGEMMLSIDYRPADRTLYGVTNMNLIYKIGTTGGIGTSAEPGQAIMVSSTPFTPAINDHVLGFDINPRTDRIFIVTDNGQTLEISPITGQVVAVSSTVFTGSQFAINGVAFSNNFSGTTGTLFYGTDMLEGRLMRNSNGTMTTVGSTGLTITGEGGFDITRTGTAFAVFNASGTGRPTISSTPDNPTQTAPRLYRIDLKSGLASSHGRVMPMIGLAIQM